MPGFATAASDTTFYLDGMTLAAAEQAAQG